MDIFQYREDLIGDYSAYVKGFLEGYMTLRLKSSLPLDWMADSFGRNPWFNSTPPSSRDQRSMS